MSEYVLISQLLEQTSISGSTSFIPFDTSSGSAQRISVDNMFDKLSTVRTHASGSGLLGRTDTGDYAIAAIGTGLQYSGGTISGVNASTTVKGVAMFNSDHFSDSSGTISIKNVATTGEIPIDHDRLENFSSNEHVDHTILKLTGDDVYVKVDGSATVDAPLSQATHTISLNTATSVSAGTKLAATDANGYLNAMVKDMVYIQLFPASENVVSGTSISYAWTPSTYFTGKTLIGIGAASPTQVTDNTITVTVKLNSGGSDSASVTIPLNGWISSGTVSSGTVNLNGYFAFSVSYAGSVCKGLDAWLIFG